MEDEVIMRLEGNCAYITLNRVEKLNALNERVKELLIMYLRKCDKDQNIRSVVISGNGKAFCAGADIDNLHKIVLAQSIEERDKMMGKNTITEIGLIIRNIEKPVIAAIHGYCFGGGFELTQYCDMIYATEDALFSQPEINIGIIPGGGGTQNLPRIAGEKISKEMILTGERISAIEAAKLRIVNRVFSSKNEMDLFVNNIVEKISLKSPMSVAYAKKALNMSFDMPIREGLFLERELIKTLYGSDYTKTLMESFLNKKKG